MKRLGVGLAVVLAACGQGGGAPKSVQLQPLSSCEDLEQLVRKRMIAAMNAEVDRARDQALKRHCRDVNFDPGTRFYNSAPYDTATGSAAPAPAGNETTNSLPEQPAGEPNTGAKEYSTTNNQVVGVDEADFLKNDSRYFYIVADGHLQILDAFPPENATVLARLPVTGTPSKLFVESGRAVVFSRGAQSRSCTYGYDCELTGDKGPTTITFVDLSDLRAPKVTRTLQLNGGLLGARRIGKQVFASVSFGSVRPPRYTTYAKDAPTCADETNLPKIYAAYEQLKADNAALIETSRLDGLIPSAIDVAAGASLWNECRGMFAAPGDDGTQLTSVFSFDVTGQSAIDTAVVVGRPGAVYANHRSLYVTSRVSTGKPEESAVHRFSIDGASVGYAGSARIPGHILNQFSMDEHEGHLRVATSIGRVPDADVNSAVTVLDATGEGLVQVGQVTGIAPTEDIRSVRFVGDRGYLVTFKKTDPLFTLDLSKPSAPRVTGELKIPGYSTYMHPVGKDHLLAIGFEAEDHGSFAYFQGLQLQIFDVRDPAQPLLKHKTVIGTRGSSSAAATDHLAFNYLASRELLALPMAICEDSGGGSSYGRMTFEGLLVFKASLETGFEKLGGIAHGPVETVEQYSAQPYYKSRCYNWWTNANSHVKRSVFMDDAVYSVAEKAIHAQRLGALGTDVAVIDLDVK